MSRPRVDYDRLAPHYDERYTAGAASGISKTLHSLVSSLAAERVLEVGCGTGHWLSELQAGVPRLYGLDPSSGMLQKARARAGRFHLIRGRGEHLPFRSQSLDLVLCVNALHHFEQPDRFVAEAHRALGARAALCIIGMDPAARRDRWYLYDYFPGTFETDLRRYPSSATIADWMLAAGFARTKSGVADRIVDTRVGRSVLEDPILQKHGTSQLALLTDDAYEAGIARIHAALTENATAVFPVDISLAMTIGYARE
jgi:SAM-dependent methyltransferase